MKASDLTKSKDALIAHVANKLCNEQKGNWTYDSKGNYFASPDMIEIYDVKCLQFYFWDDVKMNYKKHSEKDIQNAYQKITELVSKSLEKLKEAEKIADEYGLEFTFDPAYGMGGTYCGKGSVKEEYDYSSRKDVEKIRDEGEWMASSNSC